MSSLRSLLLQLSALALIVGAFLIIVTNTSLPTLAPSSSPSAGMPDSIQTASVIASSPGTTSAATSIPEKASSVAQAPTKRPTPQRPAADQAERIQNPYPFAPESFAAVNDAARLALVNILCMPRSGTLRPISGSGIVIDPRGVILTNAHVAQYVLLSESPEVNLSCFVRTGSPAKSQWIPEILYIPPVWVEKHAQEITNQHPLGTGEHDYALLLITNSLDGSPLPSAFPSLPFDAREAIGFQGDSVLVVSYPAEFIGGLAAQLNLYAASSVTSIKQLLTFETGTVDLVSLGGIIEAQSGSSGGAVVNAWGRLIALITTTSEGNTTSERDLRATTLSYISHDLAAQTQFDLPTVLGGDVRAEADDFNANIAPSLIQLFIKQLVH